ncbi:uncharacterized protein LOC102197735 isoform X2 [Pundamilia nyererei]|uniref:Uncharacterized protein LOC102197735 isoform X2 n=1 Tax=Pundamilia nyererei TaxID=303518 RepID=A0A9Y6MBD5_9CICH|nr:PREDICTED: uncharacterized protein LOC102197735 isoform X2 [Pundamilia nyererei]
MLKLIMVLLWMILLVFLLCAEAENMTEVRGELGTNVTLTCSNQTSDRYWYMEIHSQFRAAEDCRLYFCGIKRGGSTQFVETFHLISDVTQKPVALTDSNQQSELFILSSLSLNAALVLVVICLSCVSLSLKRRISKYQANLPPAGTSERLEAPQKKEIQPPPRSAAPPSEGIYYKLHLPCFTLPQS